MSEAGIIEKHTTGPEYHTLVSSIEEPMTKICTELKPRFESGEYSIIVGDDTSGRIPTLVIREFARVVSRETGAGIPPAVFLQPGRMVADEDLESQFEKRVKPLAIDKHAKKALIVTDYVYRGTTLNRLSNIFRNSSLNFDVVVLRMFNEFDKEKLDLPETSLLIVGDILPYPPDIWRKTYLTGLTRVVDIRDRVEVVKKNLHTRIRVGQAREDVHLLIHKIAQQLYPHGAQS